MSEMLTITIDGVQCTCEKGEYLYDVATRNGIWIPVLCRSDAFEDHRACCRICIVEVITRGRSKIVTSCVYPIDGPCKVLTNSERIREDRAVLYGLLGHRAPAAESMSLMANTLRGLLNGGPVGGPLLGALGWMVGVVAVFFPLAMLAYRRR